jgi:hypothetical protein
MPDAVTGTRAAISRTLRRRDGRLAFVVLAVGYPLVYLAVVGHLSANGDGSVSALVVSNPLSRALTSRGPFSWEPIARITVGPVLYLFSPLNLLVAAVLGALVAANGAVALVAYRAPSACGVEGSAGLLAAVPALVSGATCCGPALFLLVGLQASATLLGVVGVATPASVVLLLVSLLLVGRSVTPPSGGLGVSR